MIASVIIYGCKRYSERKRHTYSHPLYPYKSGRKALYKIIGIEAMDPKKLRRIRKIARRAEKAKDPAAKEELSLELTQLAKGMDPELKEKYAARYGLDL